MTRTGLLTGECPSIPSLARAMEAFHDAVRRVGAELDVPVIDLEPRIPKSLHWLIDDVHPSAAGAAEVARLVHEGISRARYGAAVDGSGGLLLLARSGDPWYTQRVGQPPASAPLRQGHNSEGNTDANATDVSGGLGPSGDRRAGPADRRQ